MHLLLDHLSAVVLAAGVVILLAFLQAEGRESAVEAVEFSTARVGAGAFLEVLEQDLANVCAGVPAGEPCVHALGAGTPTPVFEFSGAVAPAPDAPVERVRYEAHAAGTVTVVDRGAARAVPAYEVVRYVYAGGVPEPTSRSFATVTRFELALLDATGAPVGGALDATREVVVRFAAVPPTGRGGLLAVTRWQRQIRLSHLAGT